MDPDGRNPGLVAEGIFGAAYAAANWLGARAAGLWLADKVWNALHNEEHGDKGGDAGAKKPSVGGDKSEGTPGKDSGENTNPYKGPVDKPVIVVDPHGNAIPVGKGERVKTSPNGDYQQVYGSDGKATGVRLDRGGHKNQADPNARDPHAHRPGVTTPDGNPHLPINK